VSFASASGIIVFSKGERKASGILASNSQFAETDRKYAETVELLAKLEKTVDRVTANAGGLNRSLCVWRAG
jgi:hypothetical protein